MRIIVAIRENRILKKLGPFLILFALCLLAYSNSFGNDFLLDDVYDIFLAPLSLGITSWTYFLIKPYTSFYRPMPDIFFWMVYSVFRYEPLGYHLVAFFLFWAVCGVFYQLIRKLFDDPSLALLAASLYAVHPVNSYYVNWATSIRVAVIMLLMQACVWAYVIFEDSYKKRFYFLSLGLFIMALLSHELCVVLFVFIGLILYFLKGRAVPFILKRLAPFMGLSVVFVLIRAWLPLRPITTVFEIGLPWDIYLSTLAQHVFWYLGQLLYPVDILFMRDVFIGGTHARLWASALVAALAASAFLVLGFLRRGLLAFCLAFFWVGFAPLLLASFVYTGLTRTSLFEAYWVGFSLIAFFILAAFILLVIKKKMPSWLWWLMLFGIIGGLILLTRHHNQFWKDEVTYCEYWLRINPSDENAKYTLIENPARMRYRAVIKEAYRVDKEAGRRLGH